MENYERRRSILAIDDEPFMLQLLKGIFESEGYLVDLAADGVSGVSILRNRSYDLVLLDIRMPGPDGYLVIQRIREFSNVPIIIVTGNGDTESLERALGSGADGYVKKPFHPVELVARVRATLRRASLSNSVK